MSAKKRAKAKGVVVVPRPTASAVGSKPIIINVPVTLTAKEWVQVAGFALQQD